MTDENKEVKWISIHDKTQKMPVRQDFYVLFDNGQVRRHFEDHPVALATHWRPLEITNKH